jgi:hypothetical protein
MRILAVGIGSDAGKPIPKMTYQGKPVIAKVDTTLLRKLAARTGGKAFFTDQMTAMQISEGILEAIAEEAPRYSERIATLQNDPKEHIYDYYFQWPLGVSVIALALALLLPESSRGASKMKSLRSLFKWGDL